MKTIRIFAIVTLLIGAFATSTFAQEQSRSVLRKRNDEDKKQSNSANGEVTQRMQSFYEHTPITDADLTWMRVIYRSLDLKKDKNIALYYPEEPTENQENLFRIIMRLLANDQVVAYEYLDGREVFTDQYKIKVRDMLDRFHILYADAKGSSEKHPKFKIEESDVPSNEILSYYILEKWEFDRRENKMKRRVEAICPVLHRTGDFGGEAIKYPMFWIKFDALRPFLAQQYIFTDDDNNMPKYNYDDFFTLSMYDGEIYKTRNLKNMSMNQLYPDPDDMKQAQDSIEKRLNSYDKNLWVPSREELQAQAEAKALAQGDSTSISTEKNNKEIKSTKRGTSKRGSSASKKKQPKVKEAKVKSSSSSAARSVRRRR